MSRSPKIVIVDYGVGNVHSIQNVFNYLKYKTVLSSNPSLIDEADVLILPGVGAFEFAMQAITKSGLRSVLDRNILQKGKPTIGICLGMQLLFESSAENGRHDGLGYIPGSVERIQAAKDFPVPHVGWNKLNITQKKALYERTDDPFFYFDHSYAVQCDSQFVTSFCNYGSNQITASVNKDNLFGVQFHPEKSDRSGLKLFRGFVESARAMK